MTNITNGMPEDTRLPAAVVERMGHYLSATANLLDSTGAFADLSDEEKRAFAVYLLGANDDVSWDADTVERCSARHLGTFRTWAAARGELAEILGWPAALSADEWSGLSSEVSQLLTLGENAIRAHLHQLFTIVELDDDTVYVFD
ncbi:MAG: hypothetical protein IE935_10350 [Micrococcales bacterium]|nr:hypothetical protein [Micrococcales bacterium]